MYKKNLSKIAILIGLAIASCAPTHHLPSEQTVVNYRDSTILHIVDSIRVTESVHYKDLAWLGDTARIKGVHSSAYAYADTAKQAIIAGLDEEPQKERTKIIYRDRIQYRDSIQKVEVPVEVVKEKVVKVVPTFWIIMGIAGIASLLAAVIITLLRLGVIKV